MPYRYTPCETTETYHIFNRSVAQQTIFLRNQDYQRFINLIEYYRYDKPPIRFSEYYRLSTVAQQEYLQRLTTGHDEIVKILVYCCMPNHFHLLLRQQKDNGVSTFLSQVQNGYAKYFNVKTKRFGAVFQSMFKAVRIESDEQLLHVARYIHLNPFTANIVSTHQEMLEYPWSSLRHYLEKTAGSLIDRSPILSQFRTIDSFKAFTLDQADYQRLLFVESHLYHDAHPHPGGV